MDRKLLTSLEKVLDDVIDVLAEAGWEDEALWYGEIREGLLSHEPGSPPFTEMLVELEQSLFGMGSFMDVPLSSELQHKLDAITALTAQDTHQQRLGLISCASGIIHNIKKSVR